jgi:hypothetical protein
MALFGYTPAYQGHIALLGHLRYALQLNVHFPPELDLLPQPAPVLLNNFFEGPIASHSKGIAQYAALAGQASRARHRFLGRYMYACF